MYGLLIMTLLATAGPAASADIETAVQNYYSELLNDRVIHWEIEFKRCTEIKTPRYDITDVRGEDEISIPRGTRLCWVDVVEDGRRNSLPVTLKINTVEELPIARFDIPPRTALCDSLIEWRIINSNELGATTFPARNDIRGLWSKVRISAGNVIISPRVDRIPSVAIGDDVILIARSGKVEVKTVGKALGDGYIGDQIQVMNEFNGKRLKGVVENAGMVLIE